MQLALCMMLTTLVVGVVTPATPPSPPSGPDPYNVAVDPSVADREGAARLPAASIRVPNVRDVMQRDAAAASAESLEHRHRPGAWTTLFNAAGHRHRHRHQPQPQPACPSCVRRREFLENNYEDDLTLLRIEYVKQQILKKLGLTEPPVVARPASNVPKPLALAGLALPPPRRYRDRDDNREDFYGRTDQVILFPVDQQDAPLGQCPGSGGGDASTPRSCFVFKLPGDIQGVEVTRAELWLYRRPLQQYQDDALHADVAASNVSEAVHAALNVSEVANWDLDESFQRRNHLASEAVADGEGWVKLDLARPVKYWFEFNELVKMVEATGVAVAAEEPFKPFLVIATDPVRQVRRPKRNVRCLPGQAECCRDNLYVSFKDIGWDDWILQPLGYEAYFCRGSCTTAASLTITSSSHNAVVRLLEQTGKKLDLVPCCTPTKYSEISLLYINNNNTFIQKTLPNMVVEACGCN